MSHRGFVEGENLVVDRYSANGETSIYEELARAVVASNPDAMFTSGAMCLALKKTTTTIPIVASISDPVLLGLAFSLARPGGNVTGVTVDAGSDLYGKRLGLLIEARPNSFRVGYLASSRHWTRPAGAAIRGAAQQARIALMHVDLGDAFNEASYSMALHSIEKTNVDALLVSDEAEHLTNTKALVTLTETARIPAMHPYRELAVAGGLMAYYIDLFETFRYAAGQMADILRGKNPADIPFYQPTKFQLVINTKAAQRIGLEIPPSLLARADEVIE